MLMNAVIIYIAAICNQTSLKQKVLNKVNFEKLVYTFGVPGGYNICRNVFRPLRATHHGQKQNTYKTINKTS